MNEIQAAKNAWSIFNGVIATIDSVELIDRVMFAYSDVDGLAKANTLLAPVYIGLFTAVGCYELIKDVKFKRGETNNR